MNECFEKSPVDESAARTGLLFVFLVVLFYSVVHVGFRLLASNVLGEDDIIDTILVQDLRVGYAAFPHQPPLYDWVLWAVQQITGPGVVGFLLIKYTALIVVACLLYLVSLRVLKDRLFAILSVESLALIYQISWRYHEGFTHEVGAMVAVMVTAWLFLRLLSYGRFVDFVWLGVSVGLGFLTVPAYSVFVLAMLGACALQPAARARVFRLPILSSVAIAVVISSPYVWWLLSDPQRMGTVFSVSRESLFDSLRGVGDALRGPIAYLSPLLFILPFVFPRFVFVAWADLKRKPNAGDDPDYAQLFLHSALVALGLSLIGGVLFTSRGFAVHDLMPLYLTSVVWLFSVAKRAHDSELRVRWFGRIAIAIAVIALVARLANMFVLDPVCKKCRWGIPYDNLGIEMKLRGFDKGTIVSIDRELAGNLRRIFPDSKVVTRRYPKFTPKDAKLRSGKVVFVWGTQLSEKTAEQYMGDLLPVGRSFEEATLLRIPWRHIYKRDGYRMSEWKLLIMDMDGASWKTP